jgi:heat shock protein HslJ
MKQTMVTIAAAVLLAGCASKPKEPPPKPFVGTQWEVVLELPQPGEQPHLRFGDGRMEGFGGCNRIAARYVQDTVGARAIVIGRACPRGSQESEVRVLEVLQAVSSYSITGSTMTMTGSGGTLRFRALETPAEKAERERLEREKAEKEKEKEKKA